MSIGGRGGGSGTGETPSNLPSTAPTTDFAPRVLLVKEGQQQTAIGAAGPSMAEGADVAAGMGIAEQFMAADDEVVLAAAAPPDPPMAAQTTAVLT